MKNIYLLFLLLKCLLLTQVCLAQSTRYHRIRVTISPERLEYLFNNGLEVDHFSFENKSVFTAEVSDNDVALFKKNGLKVTYLIRDLEKNYRKINAAIDKEAARTSRNARAEAVTTPANFSLGSFGGYYSFAELPAILDRMRALYPNLITIKSTIGSSVEGRPLYMVKISDNPDVDENEPELLLNALHHAREPISISQLVFFMWYVLENYNTDKEIRTLLNSSEIYIVPCLNPDGYVYNQSTNPNGGGMWRKNRRANSGGTFGVDLNRNYSYNYARDNTGSSPTSSSDTYRGTAAFSEPETAALRNLAAQHQFVAAFNYHSYSNACIYPFESLNPNSNAELATFRSAATYLTAENGFKIGNAYETVGYTANGTAPDWEFGEQVAKSKIYGFTPEIGTSSDGFWPASSRIVPLCNSMIEMNRKMLRIATYYARATPSGSSIVSTTNSVLRYQFQNFSIKPASYTISATGLSPYVTSTGPAKTRSSLGLLQTVPDSIAFSLAANTPNGTQIPFELAIDNGLSFIKDTVTLTYTNNCGTPTALSSTSVTTSAATLTWAAVAGSTSYAVSLKPQSTTAWTGDINVGATSYSITGLTANTTYDWRVKAGCGTTYATSTVKTLAAPTTNCYRETGGIVAFEAEGYSTRANGTGAAANRSWTPLSASNASGNIAMTVTGADINVQNNLVGPRMDYSVNFTTVGTYYVWVRMAAGTDGIYDDSFHIGLDGTAVTLSPNSPNYNNGSTTWTWLKAAGSTAFRVNVNTAGSHTLNIWMREDGVKIDKIVMTTSATYTPTGIGPTVSGACNTPFSRESADVAEAEPGHILQAIAFPNPADHAITVRVNPTAQETQLRLLSIDGRVRQQVVIPANESDRILPLTTFPSGTYLIEVIRNNQRKVISIRKQ
ncbi:hypothetical protein GCM10027592_10220 [Spirosoma flavus]